MKDNNQQPIVGATRDDCLSKISRGYNVSENINQMQRLCHWDARLARILLQCLSGDQEGINTVAYLTHAVMLYRLVTENDHTYTEDGDSEQLADKLSPSVTKLLMKLTSRYPRAYPIEYYNALFAVLTSGEERFEIITTVMDDCDPRSPEEFLEHVNRLKGISSSLISGAL